MKRLPSISNEQATTAWINMKDRGSYDASELKPDYIGNNGDKILADHDLSELNDALKLLKKTHARKNTKIIGGDIDSEVVEPVHHVLTKSGATPFQLSQLGFWRWLSNVALNGSLWEFIQWRIPGDKRINWGITSLSSLKEVYFYRAWIKGHRMYDRTLRDPYKYAKMGSSDVWRSHILRQDFGKDKEFVKALLDTIYDSNGKTLIKTKELRTKLIPALRAWTSNSTYSHLTYKENIELIKNLRAEKD